MSRLYCIGGSLHGRCKPDYGNIVSITAYKNRWLNKAPMGLMTEQYVKLKIPMTDDIGSPKSEVEAWVFTETIPTSNDPDQWAMIRSLYREVTEKHYGVAVGGQSHGTSIFHKGLYYVNMQGTEYAWIPGLWIIKDLVNEPWYMAEIRRMDDMLNSAWSTSSEERYSPDMPGMTLEEFQSRSDSIIKEINE